MMERDDTSDPGGNAAAGFESWLTRSWRPLLMLCLLACIVFVGFILPLAELIVGHRLAFNPRWDLIPPDFWSLLTFGMGGYIGGRTVEKVAGAVLSRSLRPRNR